MTLCCRSGGCHENGRHEVPFDLMESLANSVANMLVGEHIVEQGLLLGGSLLEFPPENAHPLAASSVRIH